MGLSRQEYWSGLPFPSPGDLPDPGIEPWSPALQADALTSEPPGKPHASKAMLTTLQASLQQYVNYELQDVQAGFRKGRGTRDEVANICWIIEKARVPEKTSASLTTLKPLTVWITTNCGKFLQRWEYQTT